MTQTFIVVGGAIALWSLLAGRLDRWRVGAPVVMVLAGVAEGFGLISTLDVTLNSATALHAAELILAVLLFVDATHVRGGRLWGQHPRTAVRLVLVALPVSLLVTLALGLLLLPGLPWAAVLVVATIVMPIDYAPAASILTDRRFPFAVRDPLNVEGGWNDGIISPLFLFALALAAEVPETDTAREALGAALPATATAVAVGLVLGGGLGAALVLARRHHLTDHRARRILVLLTPLLTYSVAVALDGNGFVASFVCGITFVYTRDRMSGLPESSAPAAERDLGLLEDVTFLLTLVMWFVFGSVAVFALSLGVSWMLVVFAVAVLTAARVVPVLLATVGSRTSPRERLLLGALGPRGTTSIVFGLLAFNTLRGAVEDTLLTTTTVVVLGSLALHGLLLPVLTRPWPEAADSPEAPHASGTTAGEQLEPGSR